MNDPGTAEPIKRAADQVDPGFSSGVKEDVDKEKKKEQEEERDYRDPK